MSDHLSSAVSVQPGTGGTPPVTGPGTYRIGIVGVTERGPFGSTLVQEWEDFVRMYGRFTDSASAHVAKGVWSLLKERGKFAKPQLYVSRVDHLSVGEHTAVRGSLTLASPTLGTTVRDTLKVEGFSEGGYASDIAPAVGDASNGKAEYFNLSVYVKGVFKQLIKNCTMDSTSLDYVETKVTNYNKTNAQLIRVADLGASGTATQRRPVNSVAPYTKLSGGDDGLTGLVDNDFVGAPEDGTGITFAPTAAEFVQALQRALQLHSQPEPMLAVIKRGMTRDFSWQKAAAAYEQLYHETI